MSLKSMTSTHLVDVFRQSITVGSAMGANDTPTLRKRNVKCRIVTPAPREVLEFLKLGEERGILVEFIKDPFGGDDPNQHEFHNPRSVTTPRATNSRIFRVEGMGNPDEADVFFKVVVVEERQKR